MCDLLLLHKKATTTTQDEFVRFSEIAQKLNQAF